MSTESLVVTSATGVDVELAIAGPGSRAYAFLIDWHIRLLLALAWFMTSAVTLYGASFLKALSNGATGAIVGLPLVLIYFLYHPIVELAMRGQTPGKRMAGVRVVTRIGGTPSSLAILIRNAFRLIDSLPALYGVGLVTTIFSRQRVRLGDLAAGTLLVRTGEDESKALAQLGALSQASTVDAGTLALGNDLLLRWKDLEPARRQGLARELLQRIRAANGPDSTAPDPQMMDDSTLEHRLRAALSGRPA